MKIESDYSDSTINESDIDHDSIHTNSSGGEWVISKPNVIITTTTTTNMSVVNGLTSSSNIHQEDANTIDDIKNKSVHQIMNQESLYKAIETGNFEYIKEYTTLLDQYEINLEQYKGQTMLQYACTYGDVDIVQYIVQELLASIYVTTNDGKNALHVATEHGHVTIVSYLLSYDISILNCKKNNGFTALHIACSNGFIDIIKVLLDTDGIEIELTQNDGLTALQIAVRNNHYGVVHYLVTRGIMDNIVTPHYKQTALHMAAQNGYLTIVQCLIQYGSANMDLLDGMGWKALHFATRHGHFEVVQYLLTVNCDNICITDLINDYLIVFELASKHGHYNILKYILPMLHSSAKTIAPTAEVIRINCGGKKYVDDNEDIWEADDKNKLYTGGFSTVHPKSTSTNTLISCDRVGKTFGYKFPVTIKGWYDVLLHFSEFAFDKANSRVFGININGVNVAENVDVWCKAGGKNILIMEKYETYISGRELSITFTGKIEKAKITAIEVLPSMLHLHRLIEEKLIEGYHYASQYGHINLVRHYLNSVAFCIIDKYFADSMSTTDKALELAVQYDHENVVKLFFEYNEFADVCSSLIVASIHGSLKSVKYLVSRKDCYIEYPSKVCDDLTSLHLASRNGHIDVVKCLIKDGGANIEKKSDSGCTALHFAARFGHLEIVQYLISQKRTIVNAVSDDRFTALHYATMNGYYNVVQYLLKDGRANPCLKTKYGLTALHIAGSNNSLEIAKLLLDYPIYDIKNHKGETALDYTKRIFKLNDCIDCDDSDDDDDDDYSFKNSDMISLLQKHKKKNDFLKNPSY